jgi:hypothetical protein
LALGYTEIKNRYLKQRKIKKICWYDILDLL